MAKHARFINECVDEQVLEVMYVPSAENLADVFTKTLGPAEFERQRSGLNIEDVTTAWAEVEATVEPVKSHTSSSTGVDVDMEELHASSSTEMDIDMEEC
ncbi:uncharacterized protein IUM83_10982 [Phytophthora cinnamomi]|uniref:uncharacterized protein n=1 Tax=Phytophthora cinnamomi TaxID=4785 RepID=UPI00355A2618|nr:hypothetical protein IUM83_10982 [Phytophthora cinnamomi]